VESEPRIDNARARAVGKDSTSKMLLCCIPRMFVCMFVCMDGCMHVNTYTHTNTTHTYRHTHTRTHTHTHTHTAVCTFRLHSRLHIIQQAHINLAHFAVHLVNSARMQVCRARGRAGETVQKPVAGFSSWHAKNLPSANVVMALDLRTVMKQPVVLVAIAWDFFRKAQFPLVSAARPCPVLLPHARGACTDGVVRF